MDIEIWKSVTEFPLYSVSNYGNVRSNHYKGRPKHSTGKSGPGLLTPVWVGPKGGRAYLAVSLCPSGGGKPIQRYVHQLVLEVFSGPRPKGAWGLHWDDDTSNNRWDNLRWGTPSDNHIDMLFNHNPERVKRQTDPDQRWVAECYDAAAEQYPDLDEDELLERFEKGELVLRLPPMPDDCLKALGG